MVHMLIRGALALAVTSCVVQEEDAHGASGDGGHPDVADAGDGGGGSDVESCIRMSRPKRLRPVRVVDSRYIEPNTVVTAASQDPQTLWLPDASDNPGALVIVKEGIGKDRRVSVLVLGKDAHGSQTQTEYRSLTALSSRTFMVATGEDGVHGWVLLDPIE